MRICGLLQRCSASLPSGRSFVSTTRFSLSCSRSIRVREFSGYTTGYTISEISNGFTLSSSEGREFSVKTWDRTAAPVSCTAWKHLDIGSANYGPDAPKSIGTMYQRAKYDTFGEIIHRVLFAQADRVIGEHPEKKEFVFYLNDISSSGLDLAASNLCLYLAHRYQNITLRVRIEKIVADMFKLDPWPAVESASLLHPFGRIAPVIFTENDFINHEALKKWNGLYTRVAKASRTGLLVKESNLDPQEVDTYRQEISSGFVKRGLDYRPADASFIPAYLFPSGMIQHSLHLSYRVTYIEPVHDSN